MTGPIRYEWRRPDGNLLQAILAAPHIPMHMGGHIALPWWVLPEVYPPHTVGISQDDHHWQIVGTAIEHEGRTRYEWVYGGPITPKPTKETPT